MTDYKLKGANLEYVANNFLSLSYTGPTRMVLTYIAASNASREKLIEIFTSLYNVKSASNGKGYGEIILRFSNPIDCEEFYNEVKGAVVDYMNAHPNVTPENNFNEHVTDDILDFDDKEKSIDWTTYIIIGAAVVAIIILLWPNKRRK